MHYVQIFLVYHQHARERQKKHQHVSTCCANIQHTTIQTTLLPRITPIPIVLLHRQNPVWPPGPQSPRTHKHTDADIHAFSGHILTNSLFPVATIASNCFAVVVVVVVSIGAVVFHTLSARWFHPLGTSLVPHPMAEWINVWRCVNVMNVRPSPVRYSRMQRTCRTPPTQTCVLFHACSLSPSVSAALAMWMLVVNVSVYARVRFTCHHTYLHSADDQSSARRA